MKRERLEEDKQGQRGQPKKGASAVVALPPSSKSTLSEPLKETAQKQQTSPPSPNLRTGAAAARGSTPSQTISAPMASIDEDNYLQPRAPAVAAGQPADGYGTHVSLVTVFIAFLQAVFA